MFLNLSERFDMWILHRLPLVSGTYQTKKIKTKKLSSIAFLIVFAAIIGYGVLKSAILLADVSFGQWFQIGEGLAATALRVFISLVIALAWTIPLGVAIGMNPHLSKWLQPVVQVVASIPATALFPVFVFTLMALPGGLNFAAILLMLMVTQWYLLFNIIAGASTIPQDFKYTADMLGLSRSQRWKILILPAIFPYLITGAITASGGAWNASIVAEYVEFSGKTLRTTELGDLIACSKVRLQPASWRHVCYDCCGCVYKSSFLKETLQTSRGAVPFGVKKYGKYKFG